MEHPPGGDDRGAAADSTAARTAPGGPRAGRSRRRLVVGAGAGLIALAALGWFAQQRRSSTPPVSRAEVAQTASSIAADAVAKAAAAPARSRAIYQQIMPSLVVIETQGEAAPGDEGEGGTAPGAGGTGSDPIVETPKDSGVGTGVVINDMGAILTAYHVVADAAVITVSFADGTTGNAQIVNAEPENDIAVLMPEQPPEVIVPAVLGGGVEVGDEAYVVGHPLGLTGSMSAGVISGLNRTIPREGGPDLEGLIQFDAAANPGNSGGPLLDRNGQVVGIVTALANPSKQGFFVGIGFAVPISTAGGAAGGPPR